MKQVLTSARHKKEHEKSTTSVSEIWKNRKE